MRVVLLWLSVVAACFGLAAPAVAGPRQIDFQYADKLLPPADWQQVRDVVYAKYPGEVAMLRAQGIEMLEPATTTVALADVDFDGIDELFVMYYGPDLFCFPLDGCLTAMFKRDRVGDPWRFDSEPVSVISDGPPLLYAREEVVGGHRTLFSSPDPQAPEPAADEQVTFQHGGASLTAPEWQAIMTQLNTRGARRGVQVQTPLDVDIAPFNLHTAPGDELIVTVRTNCGGTRLCPTYAFFQDASGWRFASAVDIEDAFIGQDDLPVVFLRDERKFGWRTGYTSSGNPRRHIAFPSWGQYGMTLPMLADIGAYDPINAEWTGSRGGAYTGAEFLRDPVLQDIALDHWANHMTDDVMDGVGMYLFEGRAIQWGDESIKVTQEGMLAAVQSEGIASVMTFFGMLGRTQYKLDEAAYLPALRASFRAIATRLRGPNLPARPPVAPDVRAAPVQPTRTLVDLVPLVALIRPEQWPLIEGAVRNADGPLWDLFERQGIELSPYNFRAAVTNLIGAEGDPELILELTTGCGAGGCWAYVFQLGPGGLEPIVTTVLPGTFVVIREPGQPNATISGYLHGLRWNGRGYEQFCTAPGFCG